MAKKFEIRNSTAEFLIFMAEGKEQGIQVLYKKETIWATQKAMATLFDCSADNIGLHLKNIYDAKELDKNATTEKISVVQQEGTREVRRNTLFYNLDAIISVGYRVNSRRATQFRQWCTYVLRQYAIRGYVIDKKRMENGSFHGHTAAELIVDRADAEKEHMGLTTWAKTPNGKIIKSDVSIAKNYLKENELQALGRLVNAYLDMAKDMAERHIPMTMEDWAKRIDKFLDATDREILQDAGHITAEYAKEYAESEFEKYRVIQDRLFRSDFDKFDGEDPQLPLDSE